MRVFSLLIALSCLTAAASSDRPQIEDRTGAPLLPESALEKLGELELPPGNVAVTESGRVFFTFHPEGKPKIRVAELVNGEVKPFPSEKAQKKFNTPLGIRVDRQGRLWVLDYARYRLLGGTPRLTAWDLGKKDKRPRHYEFPKELAPRGSMLNDFQIDPSGEWAYIADSSPVDKHPAIVVLDLRSGRARRVLQDHPSVVDGPYGVHVDGQEVKLQLLGNATIHYGVDSIALDREGKWLYYASLNQGELYRVLASELRSGDPHPVRVGAITLSDGITTDRAGNVYVTDMEHSAVMRLRTDGHLETLLKTPELRWPDGFSFGPEGWLYLSCSNLHALLGSFTPNHAGKKQGPYAIYRFKPGFEAPAGH
jgi:sugar lactone lactonase YvrE